MLWGDAVQREGRRHASDADVVEEATLEHLDCDGCVRRHIARRCVSPRQRPCKPRVRVVCPAASTRAAVGSLHS